MSDQSTSIPTTEPAAAWRDLFAGRNAVYSLALGGSVTLHAVNIYVATTIMPSAVEDIGGLDYYAWSTTLFVLASILGAALSARLLHLAGARGAYPIAAAVFATGTLVCAIAPTMAVLLCGRFVQGFGGGFLYALAYGVVRLIFPERLWSRAIGLISAMWGIATLIGPAVGGIFAELGAWRAAFWSLIPFAALFAVLAFVALPGRSASGAAGRALPMRQLLLLSCAVLLLSVGSIGQGLMWNVISVVGALAVVGLLLATETRSRTRLLPAGALKLAAPLGALYATIALLMVGMQPGIFVPYLLQVLHGQSPLVAGYLAALLAIGWTISSMTSASWSSARARRGIVAGPALCVLGLGLLGAFLPHPSDGQWLVLLPSCVGLVLVGLGIGLTWPHLVTLVFQTAPLPDQDLAAAAITTVQLFATALGAAAAGMVVNLAGIAQPGGIAGASNAASWLFWLFALAPALCLLTARRAIRG